MRLFPPTKLHKIPEPPPEIDGLVRSGGVTDGLTTDALEKYSNNGLITLALTHRKQLKSNPSNRNFLNVAALSLNEIRRRQRRSTADAVKFWTLFGAPPV